MLCCAVLWCDVVSKVCAIEMFSSLSEMESWGWCILFHASILILGLIRHVVVTFILRFVAWLDKGRYLIEMLNTASYWKAGNRRSLIEPPCFIWQNTESVSNRTEDFSMSNYRLQINTASMPPNKRVSSTSNF